MTASRNGAAQNGKVTVAALAAAKRLPVEHLRQLGLHDTPKGVAIPYCDAAGNEIFERERLTLTGKNKTMQPAGMKLAAYGSERIDRANKADCLFIVEGESDCWTLWHHALPALGVPGASAAKVIEAEHVEAVSEIYIHVEPDKGGETFLAGVQARLCALGFQGKVFALRMPDGVKDPADLHGSDPEKFLARFKECIKVAPPLELPRRNRRGPKGTPLTTGNGDGRPGNNGTTVAPGKRDGEVCEAVDDPHRLARLFLADYTHGQLFTLRYWREEWYQWDSCAWRLLPAKELSGALSQRIKREFDDHWRKAFAAWEQAGGCGENGKPTPQPVARKVTTRILSDVVNAALAGMMILPAAVAAPAWLDGEGSFPANEILACKNTLLHLPSWAAGRSATHELTPAFFSTNALDYDFNLQARQPREWLAFLSKLWPDDPQAVETLQEWFGYSLLPDTSQQKILMIVGPKRSGKGTIARVLRAVVGMHNTASPTLAGLGTNFGLWPLLDKTLAIISDARLSGRSDVAVVTERLLSISGEDPQTVDRKNLSHVTAKLLVRFVILTNELPRLSDASGALVGRFIILRQTRSWYGQEDTGLTDKLLTELPGILLWSMEGWKRLYTRGKFVQPDSARRIVADMEDLASPIGAFLRECCEIGPGYEVSVRDLFDRWKLWCEEKGRKEPGTEQVFGRDLRAAVPSLDDRQPRINGKQVRRYVGIRLHQSGADDGPVETPF